MQNVKNRFQLTIAEFVRINLKIKNPREFLLRSRGFLKMEPSMGFKPTTFRLRIECSIS